MLWKINGLDVAEWQAIARTLYCELCKWGWGDFHYGHQTEQEPSVRRALAIYEQAIGAE